MFLDLSLPGMSGIKLLKEMKKEPGLKDVPVVVMTAGSLKAADMEECAQLGATAYLSQADRSFPLYQDGYPFVSEACDGFLG